MHNELSYPLARIGIIGGGQLGRMTAQQAKRMGYTVTVLDPSPRCPARPFADAQVVGELHAEDKLRALACASDLITYDIEHIDVRPLKQLQAEGHTFHPSPYLLEIIQDKWLQKQSLAQFGVPIPRYYPIDELSACHFPIVQKTRYGGYDGKGVVVLQNPTQARAEPSYLEDYVKIVKELAVMVARTEAGEIACYPVVEMYFNERAPVCELVLAPAPIEATLAEQAQHIAIHAVEALKGVGIFGVEMFLTQEGKILVNEIAPRPHNSGHYTLEACLTNQFEQHLRAISGFPLGAPTLLRPAVMFNLLGTAAGPPKIEGLASALAVPGLTFHYYEKELTTPLRKMGHITVLADRLENALDNVLTVKNFLKISAYP